MQAILLALLLWLPWIVSPPHINHCGMTSKETIFAEMWLESLGERAAQMQCSGKLVAAAQKQATYLEEHGVDDTMHIGRDGSMANERARAEGYDLPATFGNGNNIESASRQLGIPIRPEASLVGLIGSPGHRDHVLVINGFDYYRSYGIGINNGFLILLIAPSEQ